MNLFSSALFGYVFRAVLRDRIVQFIFLAMLLATSVSMFLGGAAAIEQRAFTIATTATALRMTAVLGLIIFISFFIRRLFENREIDYLLATPLTRHRLLFSMALAFMCVSFIFSLLIAAIVYYQSRGYSAGFLYWSLSVAVELSVTSMIALFFAIVVRSATVSAMCAIGYYTLARMLGSMIGIFEVKLSLDKTAAGIVEPVLKVIATVIPRFDLMAQSSWLIYGEVQDYTIWLLPVQFAVFSLLYFICAAFDLRRTQF